jgi:hypothetical protein
MQSPYSPLYSVVPTSPSRASTSTRPPIHNPYDKFTRPQFDEWIGDITNALRRALGRVEEEDWSDGQRESTKHVFATEYTTLDEDGDGAAEDSFADLKARREKVLGKMRAMEPYSDYESDEEDVGRVHESGSSPTNAIEVLSEGDDYQFPGEVDEADEATVRDMVLSTSPQAFKPISTLDALDDYREVFEPFGDVEVEEDCKYSILTCFS